MFRSGISTKRKTYLDILQLEKMRRENLKKIKVSIQGKKIILLESGIAKDFTSLDCMQIRLYWLVLKLGTVMDVKRDRI